MSPAVSDINALPREEFVRVFGGVFEHSDWIAQRVADQRPFADVEQMAEAFLGILRGAGNEQKLALIRAHPDLVGRAVLTAESSAEQAAAGLSHLTGEEVELFARYNREYKARFEFPFVICARLHQKEAILAAFPVRLLNSPETERATALVEIEKIARLRLADLVKL